MFPQDEVTEMIRSPFKNTAKCKAFITIPNVISYVLHSTAIASKKLALRD